MRRINVSKMMALRGFHRTMSIVDDRLPEMTQGLVFLKVGRVSLIRLTGFRRKVFGISGRVSRSVWQWRN